MIEPHRRAAVWTQATIGGLVAAIVTAWLTLPGAPDPVGPVPPVAVAIEVTSPIATAEVRRAAFFDQAVQPAIETADQRNREAVQRCIARLERTIESYRSGITPFVDDLTSLSTRFGIVKRMPKAWWYSDQRIDDYIAAKFSTYLFSEQQLTDDIVGVLVQFKQDIDANQKRMLVEVQASLRTADLPDVKLASYQPFFEAVAKDLVSYSESRGLSSVANFAAVMVASEVGSQVFVRLATGLLSRFAVSAAVGAAAAGGASAGGSAAGAGVGTFGGPVGTVVGFGVGLAVGLVIDWWMTERFEAQMTLEMNGYLDQVESAILDGQSLGQSLGPFDQIGGSETQHTTGLREALPVACDSLLFAYRERFFQQIVQPTLPPLETSP